MPVAGRDIPRIVTGLTGIQPTPVHAVHMKLQLGQRFGQFLQNELNANPTSGKAVGHFTRHRDSQMCITFVMIATKLQRQFAHAIGELVGFEPQGKRARCASARCIGQFDVRATNIYAQYLKE